MTYQDLEQLKQNIDTLASQINQQESNFKIFEEMKTLSLGTSDECQFLRLVSWLYSMYFEAGRKSGLKWLVDRLETYNLDPDMRLKNYFERINPLRTFFQHNLQSGDDYNGKIKRTCRDWFKSLCGVDSPLEDHHWNTCFEVCLKETFDFLDAIKQCLCEIDRDESKDEMLKDWLSYRKGLFSVVDYNNLIREVASDLGFNIDSIKKFRNKLEDKLQSKRLTKIIRDGDNETMTIKKIITDMLLEEPTVLMPLTASDVIEEFSIEAGNSKIFEILKKGKIIFTDNPLLSRQQLLDKLKNELQI